MKKIICILLAVSMLIASPAAALAASKNYKSMAILGDSLCLGFSTKTASMQAVDTFDIVSNVYRAANGKDCLGNKDTAHDYTHCYPTVLAKRLGIDTFTDKNPNNDVYNFGICANWSGDNLDLLTNEDYVYPYYNYAATFTIPDGTGATNGEFIYNHSSKSSSQLDKVITEEEIAQYDSWEELLDERVSETEKGQHTKINNNSEFEIQVATAWNEWGFPTKYETKTFKAGYGPMKVMDDETGMVQQVIYEKFYWIDKEAYKNDRELIYYPGEISFNWNNWSMDYTPKNSIKQSDGSYKVYGKTVIMNPKLEAHYHDYVCDKLEKSDLILLACGGNDIYHTFMDKYMMDGIYNEDDSMNMLNFMLYYISTALQNDMTLGEIGQAYFYMFIPQFEEETGMEVPEDAENVLKALADSEDRQGASPSLMSMFSLSDILATLNYYSAKNVNKYMEETVANYAKNYEGCIKELEKLNPNARIVLIGHYNPFGTQNYLKMLLLALFNGELTKHVKKDLNALDSLKDMLPSLKDLDNLNFDNLMKELSKLVEDVPLDRALTDMTVDMLFPATVLLLDSALGGTYTKFNDIVEGLADEYNLTYVDISDAPANGIMDPHPTEYGHKWIANEIYKAL